MDLECRVPKAAKKAHHDMQRQVVYQTDWILRSSERYVLQASEAQYQKCYSIRFIVLW